jgi:hypothetical protein
MTYVIRYRHTADSMGCQRVSEFMADLDISFNAIMSNLYAQKHG